MTDAVDKGYVGERYNASNPVWHLCLLARGILIHCHILRHEDYRMRVEGPRRSAAG